MSLGSLVGNFVTWGANNAWGSNVYDNRGWKVPLYVGLAAPTVTLIGMALTMPESPYWFILKDRVEDAKRSLRRLHPNDSPEQINRLCNELQYTVLKERENKAASADASYWECLRGPNLRRTFAALFPSAAQQLVGNQLVQSYSTCKYFFPPRGCEVYQSWLVISSHFSSDFFGIAGLSSALLGSVITSVVGLSAAIVAFFLIEMESVGRRELVFWGVLVVTLSMRVCHRTLPPSLPFSSFFLIPGLLQACSHMLMNGLALQSASASLIRRVMMSLAHGPEPLTLRSSRCSMLL